MLVIASVISSSSRAKDLGVCFEQFLNFDDHISSICKSIHFHSCSIGKIRNLLSLITTRIDYCSKLLYNLPHNKTNYRLQKFQNRAAHINCITPIIVDLYWLKIENRIIFKNYNVYF